jgi:hypothetical protein
MPEEVTSRVFMFSGNEHKKGLLKYVAKDQIPKNFGGSAPKV